MNQKIQHLKETITLPSGVTIESRYLKFSGLYEVVLKNVKHGTWLSVFMNACKRCDIREFVKPEILTLN